VAALALTLAGGRGAGRREASRDALLGLLRRAADVLERVQGEAGHDEQAEGDGQPTEGAFEHGSKVRER
jgi:hypothetical protein